MTDALFPPTARLRQSAEFRLVFRGGRRYVRSGLVVIARCTAHDTARLGLAIAKRRIPRAVDRNRVKRVVRESFRNWRLNLGRFDIVVLARSGTSGMSNQRLFEQLSGIWAEIQVQRIDKIHAPQTERHL